jgi:hypothetical protein
MLPHSAAIVGAFRKNAFLPGHGEYKFRTSTIAKSIPKWLINKPVYSNVTQQSHLLAQTLSDELVLWPEVTSGQVSAPGPSQTRRVSPYWEHAPNRNHESATKPAAATAARLRDL